MRKYAYAFSTLIFFALLTIFPLSIWGQQSSYTLKGTIKSTNNTPVEYFNVSLLRQDSSVLLQGSGFDGSFEMQAPQLNNCIIRVSAMGYKTVYQTVGTVNSKTHSLPDIILSSQTHNLTEVTITAKKPIFKQERGIMTVYYDRSPMLSDAGTLIDALRRTPGINVSEDDKISVFGRGSTIIFINDKEITSQEELLSLQSSDIEKIEIDRNPSARYSAAGQAVIRIKTIKPRGDSYNLQVYDMLRRGYNWNNTIGLRFNNRVNKFTNFFSYSYYTGKREPENTAYTAIVHPGYEIHNNVEEKTTYKSNSHNLFLGTDIELNAKNMLGVQASAYIGQSDNIMDRMQYLSKTNAPDTLKRLIRKIDDGNNNTYTANLSYKFKVDSLRLLTINASYAYRENNYDNEGIERDLHGSDPINILSNIDGRNNVYVGTIDYKTPFIGFDATAGGRYSRVENRGNSLLTNFKYPENSMNMGNKITDNIAALYINVEKQWDKLSASAGLRYEYTNSKIHFIDGNETDTVKQNYGGLFPSLAVNYDFSDETNLSLSYSRRISRPHFSSLNPSVTYQDSLSYSMGNPFLKPTYMNNLSLSLGLNSFSVSVDYNHYKGSKTYTDIINPEKPDGTISTAINLPDEQSIGGNISYNFNSKWYTATAELEAVRYFTKIPYLDTYIRNKKINWIFSTNQQINWGKDFLTELRFWYDSPYTSEITYWQKSWSLSAGLSKRFFSKKLQVSFWVYDIFETGNGGYDDSYGNVRSGMKRHKPDTRSFQFTVRFNIGGLKASSKTETVNDEEMNRL